MNTPNQAGDRRNVIVPGIGALALGRIYEDETADYSTGPISFTLGTEPFNNVIQIQSDAHFVCIETTYTNSLEVCAAGSTIPVFKYGGATLQVVPGNTGKPLQNVATPIRELAGDARLPYVWPLPYLFLANSTLGSQGVGSGVGPPSMAGGEIRITYHGYKVPRGKSGIAALDNL